MTIINRFVKGFAFINAYIAYAALIFMMIFVGIAAIARTFHYPIIGDVEFVQIAMVVLVVGSMGYTELKNGHVEVGIIVDHFPPLIQKILNIFSLVLTMIFCAVISYTFLLKFDPKQSSVLLGIKFYPIKILLIIGFVAWAFVAIQKIITLLRSKEYQRFEE
ncbi:TRAP transporter small permease [Psychrobacillus sp. NPDC096426]|uniref:TRAP transporter small permease n=1 Tax=Psychrobacillus sp. NPDC096426 TaxID=3364491 RepID=UPI0038091625